MRRDPSGHRTQPRLKHHVMCRGGAVRGHDLRGKAARMAGWDAARPNHLQRGGSVDDVMRRFAGSPACKCSGGRGGESLPCRADDKVGNERRVAYVCRETAHASQATCGCEIWGSRKSTQDHTKDRCLDREEDVCRRRHGKWLAKLPREVLAIASAHDSSRTMQLAEFFLGEKGESTGIPSSWVRIPPIFQTRYGGILKCDDSNDHPLPTPSLSPMRSQPNLPYEVAQSDLRVHWQKTIRALLSNHHHRTIITSPSKSHTGNTARAYREGQSRAPTASRQPPPPPICATKRGMRIRGYSPR